MLISIQERVSNDEFKATIPKPPAIVIVKAVRKVINNVDEWSDIFLVIISLRLIQKTAKIAIIE